MKTFIVEVPEVHKQSYIVQAETGEEAIEKVLEAGFEEQEDDSVVLYGELEYSHTEESDFFSVHELSKEEERFLKKGNK